jgi:hypothetical protein
MTDDGRLMSDDSVEMAKGIGRRCEISPPSSGRRPLSSVVCCLCLALSLMLLAGCGRKSSPFLSAQKNVTVRLDQLRGSWKDQALVLNGLVQGDDASNSLITGCRVYYVWYPLDQPPCDGCPIEMASFRDIADQIIKNDQFECRLPAFQQKGICFVRVRLMEKEGLLGPESSRIKLISDR